MQIDYSKYGHIIFKTKKPKIISRNTLMKDSLQSMRNVWLVLLRSLKEAWTTANNADDKREKIQASALFKRQDL